MSDFLQKRIFTTPLPVSKRDAFAWHQQPGALDRLLPPWEKIQVLERGQGIDIGTRVEFLTRLGPIPLRWLAEHTACCPPNYFEDVQLAGPFKIWRHRHQFLEQDANTSVLADSVEYQLPGGRLGEALGQRSINAKIERMFAFRHAVTRADLSAHAIYRDQPRLSVGITGASGMIGNALKAFLSTGEHSITEISHKSDQASTNRFLVWNPGSDDALRQSAEGFDAVIHLGAENIAARRWTKNHKQKVCESRVFRTRKLCEVLASLPHPPKVLLSASASGYYGDGETQFKGETASKGDGFLANLAAEWESACQPAIDAGIRVVHLRFGMVLSPRGGALAAMLPAFRLGAGGHIGNGRQYWSWISLDDAIGAILHTLMHSELEGPLNVVSPNPVTNTEFARMLGRIVNRPALLPLPAVGARLLLGEMAEALLLASLRVVPTQLAESGYRFRHPQLEDALQHCLGRYESNAMRV